jgi:muramoyltetrapeptide carboxypeptidase LdcA involved in peptidoglycan recycling
MGEEMDKLLPLVVTRAQMVDLENLGVFGAIAGLVIGRPFGMDDKEREELREMVMGVLEVSGSGSGTGFPVLVDVDVGHTDQIFTLPLGALCSLDSEMDEWKILEAGVRVSLAMWLSEVGLNF